MEGDDPSPPSLHKAQCPNRPTGLPRYHRADTSQRFQFLMVWGIPELGALTYFKGSCIPYVQSILWQTKQTLLFHMLTFFKPKHTRCKAAALHGLGGGSLTVYEKQPNSFPGEAWQADGGPLALLQGRKGSKRGFAVVGEASHPRWVRGSGTLRSLGTQYPTYPQQTQSPLSQC